MYILLGSIDFIHWAFHVFLVFLVIFPDQPNPTPRNLEVVGHIKFLPTVRIPRVKNKSRTTPRLIQRPLGKLANHPRLAGLQDSVAVKGRKVSCCGLLHIKMWILHFINLLVWCFECNTLPNRFLFESLKSCF